ncbi:ABC transporter permease [Rhizobium redzepovicii]|uniref:ABC transporter permease n=1 Tax=Rhizobium redzepovicii TaxID=2867518 RepID=UPI001C92C4A5|nr:ABC transporter permease [Rhizobium redzepovicii]MBY4592607.1 ABC transporter permease [Rhizobium redzepovicii]MBY4615399.1 ABC transporter permease [Rhizobium redzepovicii]
MTVTKPMAGFDTDRSRSDYARVALRRLVRMLVVPFVTLLLICAIIAFFQPRFISLRALTAVATDAAPLLMLVIGSAVVILIGGIDLSVATMASFSAVLFVIISPVTGDAGILLALGLAALIGYVQGVIHHRAQIPSFVVSFGTLGVLYGTAHYITQATAAPLGPSVIIPFLGAKTAGVPHGLIVTVLCAIALSLTLRFTRLGRDLFAVGCSERAALVAGVKVGRVKAIAFALSSFFAAGAGLMFLSQTGYSSPAMANNYLLPAIVGVVVGGNAISGGVGGIGCVLIGGLIAVMVRLGTVMLGLNPAFQNILFGIMVLVSVALTIDREKIGIIK